MQSYAGIQPGDVLAVRTENLFGQLIRIGAAIHDAPELENHIAVFHHVDVAGVPWAIEARPGGVGWRDARDYLLGAYTLNNAAQPNRSEEARQNVCLVLEQMLKIQYDWPAIIQDAGDDMHLQNIMRVWRENWGLRSTAPAHVVCSSLAAYAYDKVNWNGPHTEDPAHIQPADWVKFIMDNHYNQEVK